MGTFSEVGRSLRSLCHGTQWKYAVFWKLKHRTRMLLTWEDGYCVPTKSRDAVEDTSQNGIFNRETGIISFSHEMNALGENSTCCPIELAVANMSCHLYSLREGIIGKVAFTGKHRWIFAKSFDSKVPSEYPEEWLVQFAAGIQTILLVPVVPYGVVQLGSIEMVMEDLKVVTYIKDLFNSLQHADGAPFTLDGDPFNPLSLPSSLPGRSSSSFSAVSVDQWIQPQAQLSMKKKDLVVPRIEQMTKNVPNVNCHLSPSSRVPDDLSVTQNNIQHILGMDMGLCIDGNSWKAIYSAISGGGIEESCIFNHYLSSNGSEIIEDGIPCHSLRYEFKEPHQCGTMQSAIFCSDSEDLQGGYDCCFVKKTNDQSLGKEDLKEMSCKASGRYLSFPVDSELHKALGSAFLQEHDTCVTDTRFSGENINSSFLACKMEETGTHDLVATESRGWLTKQNDTEHLLDAVISSFYASDDSASNLSRGTSPSTSSGHFVGSCLTHVKHENDALAADSVGLMNYAKSSLLSKSGVPMSSPSGSQSKSSSMLIDEEQQKGKGHEQFKRSVKSPYVGKKKAKAADVHRPRPRDRQLIQDRIKELRELVPNGSKCSIDALLDKTIKHMLFLQSISNQAEKLKQYAHSKVDGEKRKPTEPAVHQNGASWAYDLGSQTEVCPIVVENLDQPGHMLVEMLCSEYGLFLEIAQVIKHLELTILKGVMETRSHKLWAHFIVEASRGFHRMDILWPLMRLLQRQCSPITSAF